MLRYLLIFLVGCGSSVSVGDNNGDNRDNVTNIIEPNESAPVEAPKDGVNPICSADNLSFPDGPNKNLWKPCSEGDCTIVILFDPVFDVPFERVVLTRLDGTKEELRYAQFGNGGRQHWRGDLNGSQYNGEIEIFDEAQECSAFVSTPDQRVD